jgi:hypothetical protein
LDFPRLRFEKAKERVRSALLTAGFSFPPGRTTVNLSPADLPKEGGRFELPIAVAFLAASDQLPRGALTPRESHRASSCRRAAAWCGCRRWRAGNGLVRERCYVSLYLELGI